MIAIKLFHKRIVYTENAFAEMVLWQLPNALPGSQHSYKYRLAYVVDGVCALRYDNESGKGDHRHFRSTQEPYYFSSVEKLVSDFQRDIARWNDENLNV